jgi:branched-chain amino acid transport system permease protein
MMMKASSLLRTIPALVGLLLIASAFVDMPQVNDWVFQISMLIIVAVSWNLMASAGLISLGHAAFWGVGSYAAMIAATRLGLGLVGGVVLAVAVGAALGCVLALATGRLRGIFFAISTLALAEGLRVTTVMLPDQTGGASGLYLPPALQVSRTSLFVLGAVAAVICSAASVWLARTSFSYACRAMRNNEGAAQMLGLDPLRYRMAILAISAGMVGGAGAISTWYGGYLDPDVAFTMHVTIESQIASILGGMYTVAGPIVGAIAIVILSEATRLGLGAHEGASQLAYGVVLVLGILFMPRGLYGLWRDMLSGRIAATGKANDTAERMAQ